MFLLYIYMCFRKLSMTCFHYTCMFLNDNDNKQKKNNNNQEFHENNTREIMALRPPAKR